MRASPDTAALLDAWESALARPQHFCAPSLLTSLGWFDGADRLMNATVGETDRLLFDLRTALFGSQLDCVTTCHSCGETVEFVTTTAEFVAPANTPGEEVNLADGAVTCRPPLNSDVDELIRSRGPVDARLLLQQCLLSASTSLDALSDCQCDQALAELAQADPGSSIELEIRCACGHCWVDEFDIRSFMLTELTDWAVRQLRDVHYLASRYGWSESAILRMSPWRKQIYLDACGDG